MKLSFTLISSRLLNQFERQASGIIHKDITQQVI